METTSGSEGEMIILELFSLNLGPVFYSSIWAPLHQLRPNNLFVSSVEQLIYWRKSSPWPDIAMFVAVGRNIKFNRMLSTCQFFENFLGFYKF